MNKKNLKIVYVVAVVVLVICIAFYWPDVKAGFIDGWNGVHR